MTAAKPSIDWSLVNFDFTEEELKACFEPLGRAIFGFSTLEIQVAHTLAAVLDLGGHPYGEPLLANLDAVTKQKLLDGMASILKNPRAGDPLLEPQPQAAARFSELARSFQGLLKQRNVLAHGTLAKYGDRVLVGSMQLAARLRADGGAEGWVWVDELPDYHRRCGETLAKAVALRDELNAAYGSQDNLDL